MILTNRKSVAILLAGLAFCVANPAPAQDRGQGDRNFVTLAFEISNGEVLAGRLAVEKSTSPDVKQFAQQIAGEHAQLSQIVAPLAVQVNAAIAPGQTSAVQQRAAARLQTLSEPAFDEQFIRSQIAELVFALRIYQSEIAATQDPGLKQTAAAGAKIINAHLRIADHLAQVRQIPLSARTQATAVRTTAH
jgi:putative membrane protein